MSNPRNVNLVLQGAVATQKATLPALKAVKVDDQNLSDLLGAIKERLEVREGSRGNPYERSVTLRDMDDLGLVRTGPAPGSVTAMSGVVVQTTDGQFAVMSFDALAQLIKTKIA